jgi:YhcG PDDEXK nuclease domain
VKCWRRPKVAIFIVIFDLKRGELTHQDMGQMDMYLRMYDELKRGADDGPTVGIILCTHKDASVVRYSVLQGHECPRRTRPRAGFCVRWPWPSRKSSYIRPYIRGPESKTPGLAGRFV